MSRRIAAVVALIALVAAVVLIVVAVVTSLPNGLLTVVLIIAAAAIGYAGLIRRGRARVSSWILSAMLVVAALGMLLVDGVQWSGWLGVALLVVAIAAARRAFSVHLTLPPAPPPKRAWLVWNPRSGGGKAIKYNLAEEARKRGIEAVELKADDDLVKLIQDAVANGADGLMAAGGDGTQAAVATIAAEHDLPFACIPAGTRNHFALDLGVDRDDVVGALDAFVNGGEKRVDLGEVGGRTFVNNVSLGLYAEAVQSEGYRDAKIRTILDTVPTMLAPEGSAQNHELRWTGPDGQPEQSAAVILVSNNVYRLGRALGSGTRPRMDAGLLGVTLMGAPTSPGGHRRALTSWTTPEFVVESDGDAPLGVDGEALTMPTPLTFGIRPAALRVRIAPQHPGASPSAAQPTGLMDGLRRIVLIARGTNPAELTATGPDGSQGPQT